MVSEAKPAFLAFDSKAHKASLDDRSRNCYLLNMSCLVRVVIVFSSGTNGETSMRNQVFPIKVEHFRFSMLCALLRRYRTKNAHSPYGMLCYEHYIAYS